MNKPTTVNESPNMQLEYQRLVCVPFPELVDAHRTATNILLSPIKTKMMHKAPSRKQK